MQIYIYIYKHIHVYMHMNICIYSYIYADMCMFINIYHTYTYIYIRICISLYAFGWFLQNCWKKTDRPWVTQSSPTLATVCLLCDAADAACVYCAKQQTQLDFAALCSGLRYANLHPKTCRIYTRAVDVSFHMGSRVGLTCPCPTLWVCPCHAPLRPWHETWLWRPLQHQR